MEISSKGRRGVVREISHGANWLKKVCQVGKVRITPSNGYFLTPILFARRSRGWKVRLGSPQRSQGFYPPKAPKLTEFPRKFCCDLKG
jgi:hypothetical protein